MIHLAKSMLAAAELAPGKAAADAQPAVESPAAPGVRMRIALRKTRSICTGAFWLPCITVSGNHIADAAAAAAQGGPKPLAGGGFGPRRITDFFAPPGGRPHPPEFQQPLEVLECIAHVERHPSFTLDALSTLSTLAAGLTLLRALLPAVGGPSRTSWLCRATNAVSPQQLPPAEDLRCPLSSPYDQLL